MSKLNWRGRQVQEKVSKAALAGLTDTVAASVQYAKANHNGWQNRTGTAEGSIQSGTPHIFGNTAKITWGSFGVEYFIFLEMRYNTLRNAADATYPSLIPNIKRHID